MKHHINFSYRNNISAIVSILLLIFIPQDYSHSQNIENKALPIIYWAKHAFEPLFIKNGDMKNQGIGDKIYEHLHKKLDMFEHTNFTANYRRIMKKASSGDEICSLMHLTPERSKFVSFSKPLGISPSYQIYFNSNHNKALADINSKIKLTDFFSLANSQKIAVIKGQSYGPELDRALKKAELEENIQLTYMFGNQSSIIKMLLSRRVDFTFSASWMMSYEKPKYDRENKIKMIEISDQPKYLYSYIGCSTTDIGLKAIEEINKLNLYDIIEISTIVEDFLPANQVEDYKSSLKDFFPEIQNLY